jgi:hypothetical protein
LGKREVKADLTSIEAEKSKADKRAKNGKRNPAAAAVVDLPKKWKCQSEAALYKFKSNTELIYKQIKHKTMY